MSQVDEDFYTGTPTERDLEMISREATEVRRRLQDWTSAAAIASIALSVGLADKPGLDRQVLGVGLGSLLVAVVITALDRGAEVMLLLRGAKYAQLHLAGHKQAPLSRLVWLRKTRYYAFFFHVIALVLGLALIIV